MQSKGYFHSGMKYEIHAELCLEPHWSLQILEGQLVHNLINELPHLWTDHTSVCVCVYVSPKLKILFTHWDSLSHLNKLWNF